jgi:two-component system chemotaxis response regulator CheB
LSSARPLGGCKALELLVGGLSKDFKGAILAVLHIPAWAPSGLAEILSRAGPLPAREAGLREELKPGHIYVAAPDHHLLLDDHHVVRWKGPAEDRHRPSINALFRSAAVAWRERVVGVILTGTLDDGTAGLWWVKKFGGLTMVQEPEEAQFPDMPRSALVHVEIDYVLKVAEMGAVLSELVEGAGGPIRSLQAQAQERRKWK